MITTENTQIIILFARQDDVGSARMQANFCQETQLRGDTVRSCFDNHEVFGQAFQNTWTPFQAVIRAVPERISLSIDQCVSFVLISSLMSIYSFKRSHYNVFCSVYKTVLLEKFIRLPDQILLLYCPVLNVL